MIGGTKIDLTYILMFDPGMQRPAEKPVSLVFRNQWL
jgi:hypothetical protein